MPYTSFNYIHELKIFSKHAAIASHPGKCDDDVNYIMQLPYIKKQLAVIDKEQLIKELKEYCAWDDNELSSHEDNLMRIVWIASGNIIEDKS